MENTFSVIKGKTGSALSNIAIYFGAFLCVYPFIVMILTTFKDNKHIFDALYFPDFTYFDNYEKVFSNAAFFLSLGYSALICLFTLTAIVLFASMCGYTLSRSREKYFKAVYVLFVIGLIIPLQTSMIVIYKIGVFLKLINTIPFIILLYVAQNSPFATLIYAGFTKTISREIEEAARVDGCGLFYTFFRIIFPLLLPATGTVIATMTFWFWNDFQGPLIYLNDMKTRTVMLFIYNFKSTVGAGAVTTEWGPVIVVCLLSTLPMLIFFGFVQKHLLKGLTAGAVKG